MKEFAKRYSLYSKNPILLLRLLGFVVILVFLFTQLHQNFGLRIGLFFLSWFFINEIFFHFGIGRQKPTKTISNNTSNDFWESMTLPAASVMIANSTTGVVMKLEEYPVVQDFLGKTGIEQSEIKIVQLYTDQLIAKAVELVKKVQGDYITSVDLFAAYLLLTENQTKLLLSKKLQVEDIENILIWIRKQYSDEEHPKPLRATLWGQGIGDEWVTGWTLETKKFTQDFTDISIAKPPIVVGRDQQFEQMINVLTKSENNNVLLVGDSGVGKESMVRSLAYKSHSGELSNKIGKKRVLEILVNSFLAGAGGQGEIEARLQAMVEEISHSDDIILFIPEFQNILGASGYGVDVSGVLLPYLRKGNLPIIATMSEINYKNFLQQNPLRESFEIIQLPVPDNNLATQMILAKTRELERLLPVTISYEAVVTAVTYANRYRPDDVLPGSAAILLEDVASKAQNTHEHKRIEVTSDMVLQQIEQTTQTKVGNPDSAETNLLLHLEEYLHKRVVGQNEAITDISEALRRLRAKVATQNRPVSFLFLGPTGVGKTETAKALADIYFHGQMIRLDMSEYSGIDATMRLLGSPNGQRGELTEKIHDNPFSLILLDEFEKASPDILNLFLQVLDDGRLTDNRGQTVSFSNAIIIATSNAGSEFIRERIQQATSQINFQAELINTLQSHGIFKPELLNRFDGVIAFKPLSQSQILQVVELMLIDTQKRLQQQDINVVFSQNIVKVIAQQGFDEQFGARPIRRYIESHLEDELAKEILANRLQRGNKITVDCDTSGTIIFTPFIE